MADIALFAPKLLALEGGFVNDPDDPGGATNMGVTLGTWRDAGYDLDTTGTAGKLTRSAISQSPSCWLTGSTTAAVPP